MISGINNPSFSAGVRAADAVMDGGMSVFTMLREKRLARDPDGYRRGYNERRDQRQR